MVEADLAVLGSLGIGACWGWLLAPLLPAALTWSALSTALVSGTSALAGGSVAGVLAGVAAGCAAHLVWRERLRWAAR